MSAALKTSNEMDLMSVEEFLEWTPSHDADRVWQLVDGVPVMMAPPSINHGAIQAELARIIGNHLEANRPHCRVLVGSGVRPRLRSADNLRIPDLSVMCGPSEHTHVVTDPVLIAEILSPSNRVETWRNIIVYSTVPSVVELLVVHGMRVKAELFRRGERDWPELPEKVKAGQMLTLESIGLTVPLIDVYRTSELV